MKKAGWLTILFVFLAFPSAFAREAGVTFSSMKGQVEVRPDANKKGWVLAKLQTVLQVLDHVKTFEDASAILSFEDRSTFILKPETEIILETPPEKESNIQLIAGKIWVNVKRISQGGSIEIGMSQAVCGIKGTNITCSTRQGEDRVQVLRGIADVAVRGTGKRFFLQEGAELVIRPDGRTEQNLIDIKTESEKWKNELSMLGDSINLNAVPGLLGSMKQRDGETFSGLSEKFGNLSGTRNSTDFEIQAFQKEAERFQGVLMEDSFTLYSLYTRIAGATGGAKNPGAGALLKMIGQTSSILQKYSSEVARFLKNVGSKVVNEEAQRIWLEISQIWNEVQEYVKENSRETGLSQECYKNIVNRLEKSSLKISEKSRQLERIISKNPSDRFTIRILRIANEYLRAIGRAIKKYTVVEIPQAALRELQQADDEIREIMVYLHRQVETYNAAARAGQNSNARLLNSINIVG